MCCLLLICVLFIHLNGDLMKTQMVVNGAAHLPTSIANYTVCVSICFVFLYRTYVSFQTRMCLRATILSNLNQCSLLWSLNLIMCWE